MSVFTSVGRIYELKEMDKGYKRFTFVYNIPFKTRVLKFNVWNETLPEEGDQLTSFNEGDEVKIDYTYKKSFPHLLRIEKALIDSCPICHTFTEAQNAQRIDCDGCRLIPQEEHKIRINAPMKLISMESKQYLYSTGLRVEFLFESENKRFTFVIFENSILYKEVQNLKLGNRYFVVGWKSTQPGNYLDIVDIY
jgi:hypothetical protein